MALSIAFLSAILRSLLNIIDRKSFGLNRDKVLPTLIINNLYPLLLLLFIGIVCGQIESVLVYFWDHSLIVMGLLFQLTAYAFSLSFRHMKVQEVILVSKMADLFIPLILWLLLDAFNTIAYTGTVFTTLICIPLVVSRDQNRKHFLIPALMTLVFNSLQGGFSKWLLPVTDRYVEDLIPITLVIIFWRLMFSLLLHFSTSLSGNMVESVIHLNDFRFKPLQLLRSIITLAVQMSFVTAIYLANNNFLIWPILNSTILFSIIFSGMMLKEKVELRYYIVTSVIILVVFITGYLQSF